MYILYCIIYYHSTTLFYKFLPEQFYLSNPIEYMFYLLVILFDPMHFHFLFYLSHYLFYILPLFLYLSPSLSLSNSLSYLNLTLTLCTSLFFLFLYFLSFFLQPLSRFLFIFNYLVFSSLSHSIFPSFSLPIFFTLFLSSSIYLFLSLSPFDIYYKKVLYLSVSHPSLSYTLSLSYYTYFPFEI